MGQYHLAQVNIARMRADINDPAMAGLAAKVDELNRLAEGSKGFVWRLPGESAERLLSIDKEGATPYAFTFARTFPPV